MPTPCCERCKETCPEAGKCGDNCTCGSECQCCSSKGARDAAAEKCLCKADGKCSCPKDACDCN